MRFSVGYENYSRIASGVRVRVIRAIRVRVIRAIRVRVNYSRIIFVSDAK